jgi:chromosome segregation ATPase
LFVIVVGTFFFATTFAWWIVPLTLATYAALVFLATRDPLFENRVLGGSEIRQATRPGSLREQEVSPERRARWLPRGETRQKVEAALTVHRRTVFAIEESDDVARAVLDDAVPKLHGVAERLVDVAEKREKAAGAIRDLETSAAGATHREGWGADLDGLERELRAADVEISGVLEKLLTLRARVVRVSAESGSAAQDAAAKMNADLDELNIRLDALRSTMSPPEPLDR